MEHKKMRNCLRWQVAKKIYLSKKFIKREKKIGQVTTKRENIKI